MIKSIFFYFVITVTIGHTCYNAQTTQSELNKYDLISYEFTFSEADFQQVISNPEFLTKITMAEEVIFDDSFSKILIKTTRVLEENIIKGKFRKQEIQLLSFVKL